MPCTSYLQEKKTTEMMVLIFGVHMISLVPYLVVVTLRYLSSEKQGAIYSDIKKVDIFGKSLIQCS